MARSPRASAWRVAGLAALLFACSQFFRVAGAVVAPDLQRDLSLSAEGLGSVGAAFFYAFAVGQIPLALLLDRVGARRTMTALSLVGAAGAIVFAAAGGRTGAIAGRALLGLGMAGNLMGSLKLVGRWFPPHRFATVSGVIIAVGSTGSLLSATPFALLAGRLGWRRSFLAAGLATAALAAAFGWIVRDAPGEVARSTAPLPSPAATARRLLGDRDYWLISLGAFCRYGSFVAIQGLWIAPCLAVVNGLSPLASANLILLLNIAYVLAAPVGGWLSDRVLRSRKRVMVVALAGTLAAELALALSGRGTGMVALGLIVVALGAASAFGQIVYAHIRGVMPAEMEGTAMTGVNFFVMLGGAVFLHGMGWVVDRFTTPGVPPEAVAYRAALLAAAAAVAASLVAYLFTRDRASPGQ